MARGSWAQFGPLRAGAGLVHGPALCAHSRGSNTQCPGLPVYFQWHRRPSHPWAHSPPEVQNSWESVFGELSQLERETEHTDGQWPELIRQPTSDCNPCSHRATTLDFVSNCQLPSCLPCFQRKTHQEETNVPQPITWDAPLLARDRGTAELSLFCRKPAPSSACWSRPNAGDSGPSLPRSLCSPHPGGLCLFPRVDGAARERGQAQTGQDSPLGLTGSPCSLIKRTWIIFLSSGAGLGLWRAGDFPNTSAPYRGWKEPLLGHQSCLGSRPSQSS